MTHATFDGPLHTTSSAPPTVRSCGLSDPGRNRPSNEDRFLIGELVRTLRIHRTNVPQPRRSTAAIPGTSSWSPMA